MALPILINYYIQEGQKMTINTLYIIVFILLFSNLIQIFIIYLREKFSVKFNTSKARELYNKMFKLEYDKLISLEPTYIVERIGLSINSLYSFLSKGFTVIFSNVIVCIAGLAMTYYINPILMVVLFFMLPINYFGFKYLNRKLQEKSIHMQEQTSSGFKEIISICRHSDYIKQLGDTESVINLLNPSLNKIYSSMADVNTYGQILSTMLRMLNSLVKNIAILMVSIYVLNGEIQAVNIILISILLPIYFEAINQIVNSNIELRDLKGSNEFIQTLEDNEEVDGDIVLDGIDEIKFEVEELKINEKILCENINGNFIKVILLGLQEIQE